MGENDRAFVFLLENGTSRGGEVATADSVGDGAGEAAAATGEDVVKTPDWTAVLLPVEVGGPSNVAAVDATLVTSISEGGDAVAGVPLLSGFGRENPNQDDREGEGLTTRMVSCGSAQGNGTVVSWGCSNRATSRPPSGTAAGSSGVSRDLGESVRSTGLVIVPKSQSATISGEQRVSVTHVGICTIPEIHSERAPSAP